MSAEHSSEEGSEGLAGVLIPADPYCPKHGNQPTAYTKCSCEGLHTFTMQRRAESAEAERDDLRGRLAAVEAACSRALVTLEHGPERVQPAAIAYLRAALANPSAAQGEGEA